MKKFLCGVLALLLVISISAFAFAEADTWVCSNGHENLPDSLFCGKCGEAKPEEVGPWTCINGHENPADNLFCTVCGEKRELPGEQRWKEPFENEEYESALPLIQKAADQGDVEATAALAMCCLYGYGMEKDYDQGFELAQQAADAGNARGMFLVGRCYDKGNGVSKDYDKAKDWYLKAADLGDDTAMNRLGGMYQHGTGVSVDYRRAVEWYKKAAELGNDTAMYNLGRMYETGKGVSKDFKKAREWYEKAADKGNKGAAGALSVLDARTEAKRTEGTTTKSGVTQADLLGYWMSKNGMYTFEMKEDGSYTTTIPCVPYSGDYYVMQDGVIYEYYSNNPTVKTANYKITKPSAKEIKVYSYQTKTTYTLYKKR